MTKRLPLATLLGVFVLLVLGGNTALAGPPPAYFVDESKLPFEALPATSTTRYWGVHGGAGYKIEVPDDWNGDLVLYAHGFRGTGLELTVSDPRLRQEAAFAALVNWVVNDVKPAGDDTLNPAAVADPKFGCQFSVPGHAGFPACTP